MSEPDILVDYDRPVVTVTFNRPDAENRLSAESLRQLQVVVTELGGRDDIHAVVFTGAGDAWFSAGLLNPDIRAALSKEEVLEIVFFANSIFDCIEELPQIVIAAINGDIRAGAVELALACDIRLAANDATLAMPEAKWGGFPGAGGPVRLPGVVGHGNAMILIGTGREIGAEEMLRLGLVDELHPRAVLKQAATALAREIGGNGPLATRGAKRIARARQAPGQNEARKISDELRRALEYSADVAEGIAAHAQGRPPEFTGS